ncbi:hypothetical protein SAMN04487969_1343 [Paenibacillus algorifonticola]|uniref:Carbohydrate binding domain-containing protein n=1 Tax=Paenibacillus algorifonticola TaxID=684063 RepID=A0A1I2IEM7_9BACL|nr:hypothetical protein [Paenibacillus algorifonticola]SFF40093.1 hypothetical protein SAMN04487969_1343 [Paenibacillus algorifonticola]
MLTDFSYKKITITLLLLISIIATLTPKTFANLSNSSKEALLAHNNENLIINSDFELMEQNGRAKNWGIYGAADFSVVSNQGIGGSKAQKIMVSNLAIGNAVSVDQIVEVVPNTPFVLSGRFNIESLSNAKAELHADFYSPDAYLSSTVLELPQISTNGFVTLSGHGEIPEKATIMRIYALIRSTGGNGAGTIYVDSIKLAYTTDKNLVVNSDFKQSTPGNNLANSWSLFSSSTSQFSLVDNPSSIGKKLQKIAVSNLKKNEFSSIYQVINVSPKQLFNVNSRVLVESLTNAKVQIYADFMNGSRYVGAKIVDLENITSGGYATISGFGEIPESATSVTLHVMIRAQNDNASGVVYIDNINFEYAAEENQLKNGSFELLNQGNNNSGMNADSWLYTSSAHSAFELVTDQVSDGLYAQKITTSTLANNQYVGISQVLKVTPGEAYSVSGRLKVDQIHHAKVQLYLDFSTTNSFVSANIIELPVTTFGEYINVSNMGVVPQNAVFVRIYAIIRSLDSDGAGTFFVDDMRFSQESNLLRNANFEREKSGENVVQDWKLVKPVSSIEVNQVIKNQSQPDGQMNVYSSSGLLNYSTQAKNEKRLNTFYKYDLNGNLIKKLSLLANNSHTLIYQGSKSQKVAGSWIPKNEFYSISQTFIVKPNLSYKVSGHINVEMLYNSKLQLYVDFYDFSGNFISSNITNAVLTNGQYMLLENQGQTPNQASFAKLHFLLRANEADAAGIFYVDKAAFYYS